VAGSCEYGNEPLGSVKGYKFLDQPRDNQLVNKDSVP
jgi:hypothetical protein